MPTLHACRPLDNLRFALASNLRLLFSVYVYNYNKQTCVQCTEELDAAPKPHNL